MLNLLENSCLFTHQAVTEQHDHSFGVVSSDERASINSVLTLFLVSTNS